MQDTRHPIHWVRIPYSKFSSPKTCRNVHEISLKIGHTPEGHWYARERGCLEIVWRRKHANEETSAHFSRFSFGEILWKFVCFTIWMPTSQNNFLTKFYLRISFFNHKDEIVRFLRAILQESEAKLEMKIFNPSSFFLWREVIWGDKQKQPYLDRQMYRSCGNQLIITP